MDQYSQMLAFIWSTECGSFSAAARAHEMTPSAISKLIARLEDRLRVRLFQRGSRVLTLTEEGAAYLRSAKAVVEAMSEADSLAEGLPSRVSGTLRIHTMTSFAKQQIVPWLPEFLDTYPGLDVEIQLGAQFVDQFEQGLDIAIHSGILPSSSRIAKKIGECEWLLCASPDYLEKYGIPQQPQDLMNHRCFNFSFASPWNKWAFIQDGLGVTTPVKPRGSFTQGELLRDMAKSGAGIVRLADFHIGKDIQDGSLVLLLDEYKAEILEPIYLLYSDRKHLSPRIRVFIEFFQEKWIAHPWKIVRGLPGAV
ncbi:MULTISPECIES: LysR family transcriptional regulator [Pseudomonas]|jgi:DNA-binding transcriptional LysR family regulator|uniref:LysR family transcriptional regulator n=1 Tax=Pseudomonas TaxID=286 RepID=UPI000BA38F1F|nr:MULTISPECIES: LysR family transcriptional regulator [unclassified Pseudomonas]AZZ76193.1 LysR family transcriptional regulator [Pseudomonas sp. RU47]QHF50762.1 LysR family transcriptional regulator [Pseudomonas sp. S49]VVM57919.1 HTH-type transcriptional regulator PgrR [Pseudomonas fluorescens]VVN55997.1 HTH-type transcriptional regulator PgrR [Pseudomonas fluorescens]